MTVMLAKYLIHTYHKEKHAVATRDHFSSAQNFIPTVSENNLTTEGKGYG